MTKVFYLIIGGAAGTLARYFLTVAAAQIFGTSFPYGTIAVNLIGCLIIGFLASWSPLDPNLKLLLMAGFCGAFTTFSAFMLETDALLKNGGALRAFLNVAISLVFGFLAFRLGALIAAR